jgi:hypothetical protein
MQAILSKRKRHLKKQEQKGLKLPLWPELSIARIWPEAMQLPQFGEYMPPDWSLEHAKKIERGFMYGVLTTLAPDYVEKIVDKFRRQRFDQQAANPH